MAIKKKSNNHAGGVETGESVLLIPLANVKADFDWNVRHGILTEDSGDEEQNNFTDLMNSIEIKGQDTPVVVRPIGNAGKYSLVSGFRRFAALTKLLEKHKGSAKFSTIKAFVRNYSETEAEEENIRENSARHNLSGPDLAWGIHRLVKTYKEKNKLDVSGAAIAATIGKNQGYVAKLMRIMAATEPTGVAKMWREAPFQVSINDMEKIAAYEADRQKEAFEEIVKNRSGAGGAGSGGGRGKWLEAAVAKAESVGALLGRLAKKDLVDFDGLDFEDTDHIRVIFDKLKEDATEGQVKKVGKALSKSFEEARTAKDPEPDAPPASSKGATKRGRGNSARAEA